MSRYIALTTVLMKSLNFPLTKNILKDKAQIKKVALFILLILAFLPMMFAIGSFVSAAYWGLSTIGQEGLILSSGFSIVSMAVFFFSIFYVMSVFYYSKDIETLLPLPLKPSEILAAKFTVTLLYEYVTEAVFLFPILISFGLSSGAGVSYYLYGLVVFLTLPVVPLIYASVLNMFVMRFTNIGKNRDRFRIIGGIAAMFLALGLNFSIQKLTNASMDPEKLKLLMTQGDNSLVNLMSGIFFSNRFAVLAMIKSNMPAGFLNLLIYLLIALLFVLLFMFTGEGLYFKGVIGISEVASRKRRIYGGGYAKAARQSPALKALVLKELRLLSRTPVYFMNCVLMNFLWPAFLLIPILAQPGQFENLAALGKFAESDRGGTIILAAAFAISLFVSSSNGITASAISREGRNLYINKFLPINYGQQLMAKVLSGVIMSFIGICMMLLAAALITDLPLTLLVMIFVACLFSILFSAFAGILIDLNFPKLVWDSEQKAVKQNLNVAVNMLLCIGVAAASACSVIFLEISPLAAFTVLVVLFSILDLILYYLLMHVGVRLLSKMDA